MIEINLIPDVKQELLKAQRTRAIVISGAIVTSIIAAAAVVLLLVYIYAFQNIRGYSLDNQIKDRNAQLSQVEDLSKILTIQNQLSVINTLNDNKNINSRIFDVVSAVVPPEPNNVLISQINVDNESSTVTLEGQTANFNSMEVFKKTLDSAIIVYTEDGEQKEVKLATTLNSGEVTYGSNANNEKVIVFTVSFEFPEELFSPKIPTIAIKLSINGNVTDSYLGIPRSIFTQRANEVEE